MAGDGAASSSSPAATGEPARSGTSGAKGRAPRLALLVLALALAPLVGTLLSRTRRPPLPRLGPVPTFSLVDQTGAPFERRALDGKIWVADFIFTRCTEVCPRLTERMARLSERLARRGLADRVGLVSFSVDPEHDTPERLRAFAAPYGADPRRWRFVTGPSDAVRAAVVEGFRQTVDRGADEMTIVHGSRFALVDAQGTIRGLYDVGTPEGLDRLEADLSALAAGGGA